MLGFIKQLNYKQGITIADCNCKTSSCGLRLESAEFVVVFVTQNLGLFCHWSIGQKVTAARMKLFSDTLAARSQMTPGAPMQVDRRTIKNLIVKAVQLVLTLSW